MDHELIIRYGGIIDTFLRCDNDGICRMPSHIGMHAELSKDESRDICNLFSNVTAQEMRTRTKKREGESKESGKKQGLLCMVPISFLQTSGCSPFLLGPR